jgi:transcriptional regulator with XRE-family HTH domain
MDDQRFGSLVRAVRIKRKWRQKDLADRAHVSPSTVSRIERGHLGTVSLATVRRVAAALDIRVELVGRWRAGDLDRLLNAKHSALHEQVARMFRQEISTWVVEPEVSFSIFGERGVIDVLAWHPASRALLVIELKTDIVDVNELVGGVDRKRRLARDIGRDRGWDPAATSVWVIVASGRTNRARISAHSAMLRAAYPMDGRGIRAWLTRPSSPIAALSMWHNSHAGTAMPSLAVRRRVRNCGPSGS